MQPLDGLNLCGAGRVVCLIDPVGDVYACPFVIDREFLAGNVRQPGGFAQVWRHSDLFASLREPQSAGACASCGSYDACQGGCMAAKFFTGLPLDGPDPECVFGHGEEALAARPPGLRLAAPGHSKVDVHGNAPPRSHSRPPPVARPRLTRTDDRSPAMDLGNATWPEVEATGRGHVLAVPVWAPSNSTGPISRWTRTRAIAVALAGRLAAALPGVAVGPALPYGASGEHAGFPGHPGGPP